MSNLHPETVRGFGEEWTSFDQTLLRQSEAAVLFDQYFAVFPWESLPPDPEGFDLGCGSGRWALFVAPRVRKLHCIDASPDALRVAKMNLSSFENCEFHLASVDQMPLPDAAMDFGYSLGVLHHVPDTAAAIRSCVMKLKPRAPLLLYLYYDFEDRPRWFRGVWKVSDWMRRRISRLSAKRKRLLTDVIAAVVYLPLARVSWLLSHFGVGTKHIPLSFYKDRSFYTMRTDALDRFGTILEQRFSRAEIQQMMESAGLRHIAFSEAPPFWCAVGLKDES
ncbi:MAG: class I SAM-dependent methyltransferase [Actinomycetota bacterium]|nr:class I SAM-dependent methyltransferase [Actinomycetota bacterium]